MWLTKSPSCWIGSYLVQSEVLRNTPASDKEKVSKAMHRVMDHNQLFYCTNNEIVIGEMPKTNMDPIHAEVCDSPRSRCSVISNHV